jgi:hypothetical protein
MSKADREALLEQRRLNIVDHIRAGHTSDEISDAEGMDRDDARKQRKAIADAEGLDVHTIGRSGFDPVGLIEERSGFRNRLGDELERLRRTHHALEIAKMTGLTQSQQRAATQPVPKHNWTVSQIKRLADARGRTFEEMITFCNTRQNIGFRSS